MPTAFLVGLVVWRRLREERVLAEKLDGYAQHMQQTRWRLVPGLR